jgi:hypothetical protein
MLLRSVFAIGRRFVTCAAVAFLFTGCGGATPQAANPYTFSIRDAGFDSLVTDSKTVVLFDGGLLSASTSQALLVVQLAPVPSSLTFITWTSDNPSIAVSTTLPGPGNYPPAVAGEIYASIAHYGTATVTAHAGAPVNESAQIKVYAYPSVSLGCNYGDTPAYAFDSGAKPNGLQSDLYATDESDVLSSVDPCYGTPFLTAPKTGLVFHYPYGGVIIPGGLQTFTTIAASQWSDAGTQAPGSIADNIGIAIFKTRGGRIVKALVPSGPYEVAGPDGTFAY